MDELSDLTIELAEIAQIVTIIRQEALESSAQAAQVKTNLQETKVEVHNDLSQIRDHSQHAQNNVRDLVNNLQQSLQRNFANIVTNLVQGNWQNLGKISQNLTQQIQQKLWQNLVPANMLSKATSLLQLSGFRAQGGHVAAQHAYIVGEKGPEMFVPQQSGHIVPNQNLAATQATEINININSPDYAAFHHSKGQILAEIQQSLQSGGY